MALARQSRLYLHILIGHWMQAFLGQEIGYGPFSMRLGEMIWIAFPARLELIRVAMTNDSCHANL